MKIILLHRQSLIDISVQVTGKAENALLIAKENGFKITDDVKAGTVLNIVLKDEQLKVEIDNDIVNYYNKNNIKPACGLTDNDKKVLEKLSGISIWAIGVDFVIQ